MLQYFGELALLANEPRAASVVATTDVALLKMSKGDFDKTMGPLAKYLTDKARSNYGLMGPTTKDIKLSDLKIVRPLTTAPLPPTGSARVSRMHACSLYN
jgi:hypothetical protein